MTKDIHSYEPLPPPTSSRVAMLESALRQILNEVIVSQRAAPDRLSPAFVERVFEIARQAGVGTPPSPQSKGLGGASARIQPAHD